jgi:GT2 family glycosyltransferase
MKPLVDIVIPVHGRPDLLTRCLEAVFASKVVDPIGVVLVDDCSPNAAEMQPVYAKFHNLVRVVKHDSNKGFPVTVNDGAAKGTAPLILLLNSDVILEPDAIDKMVREMDDPKVGVVGALLIFPDDTQWQFAGKVQHAGMAFGLDGKPFHVHIGWDPQHPRVQSRKTLQCVTGACFMTRRSLWNEFGGMNKIYGRGTYEDVEFCQLTIRKGLQVIFTPTARGLHYTGGSVTKTGVGFPLQQNFMLYKSRNPTIWDEYRVW